MNVSHGVHGTEKKNNPQRQREAETELMCLSMCELHLLGVCLFTQWGREWALQVMLEQELQGVEFSDRSDRLSESWEAGPGRQREDIFLWRV